MIPLLARNSFASVPGRFANSRHPCHSRRKSHRSCDGRSICRNGSLIGPHAPLLALMLRPSGSNLGGKVCLLGGGNEKTWLSTLVDPLRKDFPPFLRPVRVRHLAHYRDRGIDRIAILLSAEA